MKPRIRDVPATIRLPGAPGIDAYRSSRSRRGVTARGFTARGFTARGFTVLELVVVIAVVAVLTSILMPALAKVREGGDRLQCASNLRQVGCAMIDYADDYRERLPHLALTAEVAFAPQFSEAMALTSANGREPDGLGRLLGGIGGGYLSDPRVLYCPCHRGDHTFKRYEAQLSARRFSGTGFRIFGNYHFRGNLDPVTQQLTLTARAPDTVVVVDGLRTRRDFSHIRGTNRLKADCSVDWFADVSGSLYRSLPMEPSPVSDPALFSELWRLIDNRYTPPED